MVVFETVDQIAHCTFVEKWCPCRVKVRWMENALAAMMLSADARKGDAAQLTERWRYYGELIATGGADMWWNGIGKAGVTDMAGWREHDIE